MGSTILELSILILLVTVLFLVILFALTFIKKQIGNEKYIRYINITFKSMIIISLMILIIIRLTLILK